MKKNVISWVSIGVALASAVGIYFLPSFSLWFLIVLIANLLLATYCGLQWLTPRALQFDDAKRANGSAIASETKQSMVLVVCRLLVGALFIFSSFLNHSIDFFIT